MSYQNILDRVPQEVLPNGAVRYGIYDASGNLTRYEYIKREDEPIEEGTPINRGLLSNIQGDLYTQDRYNSPQIQFRTDISGAETLYYNNIFPTKWTYESAKVYNATNAKLTVSSNRETDRYLPPNAFGSDHWISDYTSGSAWIKVYFTSPQKITKMNISMGVSNSGITCRRRIQGSNDNSSWTDLYTETSNSTGKLKEYVLTNSNYYSYYRILFDSFSEQGTMGVSQWTVTEYAVRKTFLFNLDLPLTSYDKGKIVNIQCGEYDNLNGTYTTVFQNPYMNINGLGIKAINGTINSGQKHTLVYNGSSWEMAEEIIEGTYTGDDKVDNSKKIYYSRKPKFIILEGYELDGNTREKVVMGIVTKNNFYGWQTSGSSGLNASTNYGTPTMFDTYFIPNYNATANYGGFNYSDYTYKYILIY